VQEASQPATAQQEQELSDLVISNIINQGIVMSMPTPMPALESAWKTC
jgi:hypothetical protein